MLPSNRVRERGRTGIPSAIQSTDGFGHVAQRYSVLKGILPRGFAVARRSAATARTLILAALILQGLTVLILLILGLYLLAFPILGGVVLFLAFLAFIWLILLYVFSYSRVEDGDYEGALIPTLVFAILALVTGGIASGILLLIGYLKLNDALDEGAASRTIPKPAAGSPYVPLHPTPANPPFSPPPAAGSAPASSRLVAESNFCQNCGRPTATQAQFCRTCGAALS
jgi:hypothetical protein